MIPTKFLCPKVVTLNTKYKAWKPGNWSPLDEEGYSSSHQEDNESNDDMISSEENWTSYIQIPRDESKD